MLRISYAITACNEHVELERLLDQLKNNIRPEDEVVIQIDTTATEEVKEVASKYPDFATVTAFPLAGDFAQFKNNLSKYCTREFIFQIDADEYPHPHLLASLPEILEYNYNVDVFLTPRINTVEGLTEQHIQQWGWNVNEKGWVNWADWQMRIYKNAPHIRWKNKVHEVLEGFKIHGMLPVEEEWALYHPKTIDRQERQNSYYDTL
jgi:hypothetical protein